MKKILLGLGIIVILLSLGGCMSSSQTENKSKEMTYISKIKESFSNIKEVKFTGKSTEGSPNVYSHYFELKTTNGNNFLMDIDDLGGFSGHPDLPGKGETINKIKVIFGDGTEGEY